MQKEKLALRDPDIKKLTDTQRSALEGHLKNPELNNDFLDSDGKVDPQKVAEAEAAMASDAEYDKRKSALHEQESDAFALDQGGVNAWKARRQAEEEMRLESLTPEEFSAELLLGICFLRGVPEDVVGEIGEGEKRGCNSLFSRGGL
jgi:hypothetical protein